MQWFRISEEFWIWWSKKQKNIVYPSLWKAAAGMVTAFRDLGSKKFNVPYDGRCPNWIKIKPFQPFFLIKKRL